MRRCGHEVGIERRDLALLARQVLERRRKACVVLDEQAGRGSLAAVVVHAVRGFAEARQNAVADLEDQPVALEPQARVPAVGVADRAKAQRERTLARARPKGRRTRRPRRWSCERRRGARREGGLVCARGFSEERARSYTASAHAAHGGNGRRPTRGPTPRRSPDASVGAPPRPVSASGRRARSPSCAPRSSSP